MATSDERFSFFYYLGFTPCEAEQSLRGMELHEKRSTKRSEHAGILFRKTYS